MIITKKVFIKMNGKHISKYRAKGYLCEVNDYIEVDIEDIHSQSNIKINAICDVCLSETSTSYLSYNNSIRNGGFYACSQKCSNKKVRKTNMERYGVEVPAKNNSVMDKMKLTSMTKYNVDNQAKLDINTKKAKKTKKDKYGSETYVNPEKAKETCIEKYGVSNTSKLKSTKEKKKATCLKNHGVEHPSQNIKIFNKIFKKYKHNDIIYQSSNELNFIKLCEKNKIEIDNPKFNIDYFYEKNRKYYPDFYLPKYNLVCEVKCKYTMNVSYDKNISKKIHTENLGYVFIFIIDNDFTEFFKIIRPQQMSGSNDSI